MSNNIIGINQIKEILPYRYPMLMVDRVCIEDENKCIGLKNVSFNEQMFNGHFPDHPIFPGVLQVEAMKQVAEIVIKDRLDPKRENDIYIKSLKKVKFRRPNNPGDRMKIEVEMTNMDGETAEFKGVISNNSGATCQAELTLAVRPPSSPEEMPELFSECDKSDNIDMDINDIMALIPHRYPFLLVDYIVSVEGSHVVAVKNTSFNEPIFRGYTTNYPVLPGSVQAEMVAQAGCVYQLSKPENRGKIAYFMSIQESEFFHPVHPGDQLICEVDLPEGQSRFGRGYGFIRVEDKVVSKTSMTFAIVNP